MATREMRSEAPPSASRATNLEYYLRPLPGRADYWRRMAAPRFRVATLLRLIAEAQPASLVDLGCGGGELLGEIHRAFPGMQLAGVDLSEAQIAANAARDPAVAWRAMDLDAQQGAAPELAARFDIVVAAEILEHLEHPEVFLTNARSLAVPGRGRLLLSTQSGRVWETERRVGHRRHFDAREMEALLCEAGWRPLAIWNAGWPFHDLAKRFANRDPERTMRRFSDERYGFSERAICAWLRLAFRLNSQRRGAQLFAVAGREG
jgi:2-polyprenyl-3-methyl-5-hydroxy-6-metoxy-1,4-benzoquinol methylase